MRTATVVQNAWSALRGSRQTNPDRSRYFLTLTPESLAATGQCRLHRSNFETEAARWHLFERVSIL